MNNFWLKLKKPFFVLAPMADVTDVAFRSIITKYGKPDVLWTEFVSGDGLVSGGMEKLKYDLLYSESERPIVAQLFSSNVVKMREASRIVAQMGFDGIDINMGCPDRSIEKQGCGASMIKTPERASEIIEAVKDGIKDAGRDIPVSVKTRIGYNKVEIDTWIPFLLSCDIACLSVHMRTRKEMSSVPAHWEYMKDIVKIRDEMNVETLIIGNGDVEDLDHAKNLAYDTGCDGIMIGRAIFGNPWLFKENTKPHISPLSGGLKSKKVSNSLFDFSDILKSINFYTKILREFYQKIFNKNYKNKYWLEKESAVSIDERLRVLVEHTKLFEEKLGGVKNFAIMKKHYKAYANGFVGAKELRVRLMEANNANEVESIIEEFLRNNI